MIVWTPAVLGVLHACVLYFCICTCSAQLSMFRIERRSRNAIIITIITITIIIIIILSEREATVMETGPATTFHAPQRLGALRNTA